MTHIKFDLQDFNFVALSRRESNPRTRVRFLILAHLKDGKTYPKTAEALKVSPATVKRTYKRFKESGIECLGDKPRTGPNFRLPKYKHEDFKKYILKEQENREGGRLTGYDVQDILLNEWNTEYSLSGVYSLMHRLNLAWITSRSKHPKSNQEDQDEFKKNS